MTSVTFEFSAAGWESEPDARRYFVYGVQFPAFFGDICVNFSACHAHIKSGLADFWSL